MILYDKKPQAPSHHKKTYNAKASDKNKKSSDSFSIEYPGVITIRELEQALWEDMKALETLNIKYISNGKLYLPLVNEYGETIYPKGHNGRSSKEWISQAYRSYASDFKL